ncbi:unnamed protein product [Discosporangium mesarthrocarpum]
MPTSPTGPQYSRSPRSPLSQRPPSPFQSPSSPTYEPIGPRRSDYEDISGETGSSPPRPPSPSTSRGSDSDGVVESLIRLRRRRHTTHWARDVSSYDIMGPIGEGTYGKVWKARDPVTGDAVALKMIKTTDKDGNTNDGGFPITSIREIRILRSLTHPNIVDLKEVVTDRAGKVKDGRPGDVYMVFEYLEYDLWALANSPDVCLTAVHIKTYMKQMLSAIDYMHQNKVMHRDLKCANLFIGANGMLKVGDWGLARSFHGGQNQHTPTVITLWYRPPEVLLRTNKVSVYMEM